MSMSKSIIGNTPETLIPIYETTGGVYTPQPPPEGGLFQMESTSLSFDGAFLVSPTPNGDDATYGLTYVNHTCRVARGTSPNTMFLTGHDNGASGCRYLGEVNIPALVNSTNPADLNIGTFVQNWRNVRDEMPSNMATVVINGIYYDKDGTGRLYVGGHNYYDSNGTETRNLAHYSDATDLENSTKTGFYAIGNGAEAGGQLIPIPAHLQETFGGTHFSSNGVGMSIISRSSVGHSLHVVDASNVETNGIINTVLNFPYGDGTMLCGDIADLRTSQIWNFLTLCAGGVILPGTNSILFIGRNWDTRKSGNNVIYYKNDTTPTGTGTDDTGKHIDGYFPFIHDAWATYFWLYDLNQLALTVSDPVTYPPHLHRPYQHGYLDNIPYTAWDQGISGIYLDDNNKLICAVTRAARPRISPNTPAFIRLAIEGIST